MFDIYHGLKIDVKFIIIYRKETAFCKYITKPQIITKNVD